MKVTITGFAKQQIRETARYIQMEFGRKYRNIFIHKVQDVRRYLAINPHLGPIEPLLSDCPTTYRSVVVTKLNKMIYSIADDHIEVVDLWECRREPNKQREQTIAHNEST
ncbi:MAG: type II toxin-antitoxin system RelE/ParE family toxin [Bacteroidaceae bacterium]|nr:type II toxin-antitoxin system RelE/ParE family toxin [Bacteroidaceae bacterium]